MEDQVEGLRKRDINCAALMGNLSRHEVLYILEQAELGAYKLLYISPERLSSAIFRKRLPFLNITLIAVDEAHCISQWGYDFRPHYLRISEIRDLYPDTPVIALTASATSHVCKDICAKLKFNTQNIIKGDFSRHNLIYLTRQVDSKIDKLVEIINYIQGSAIIYVRYREQCHQYVKELGEHGINAIPYHAGMLLPERKKNQELWMKNQIHVIVATSAFGMGVDKPDVRTVIHLEMPDSLEAYYQEAGRAGRDGNKAFAILLESKDDEKSLLRRISQSHPPKEYISRVYQDLANYFIIGAYSGQGSVFPFNLFEFCTKCKLHGPTAMAAIKILEMSDYITLLDEMDNPSKLRVITPRHSLYSIKFPSQFAERVVETIMRMYTGILNDLVHINEDKIAIRLNTTRDNIYSTLVHLSKCDIVKYIPFRRTPLLIYNQDRVPTEELVIPRSVYDDRHKRSESRAQCMLHYAHQDELCRERVLMQYFDVDNKKDCGICDVCAKNKTRKETVNNHSISEKTISNACIEILRKERIIAHQMTELVMTRLNLSYEERSLKKTLISSHIRALIDSGVIKSDGIYISL